jgi:L-ascorbate metabolism protein UlaG (beta-lactamase superfamily)
MKDSELKITYAGGPTALVEFGGVRFLTDPTFDPAGGTYDNLHKLAGPALQPDALGRIDVVLLSHDHHPDNLDNAGRSLLARAGKVLTTPAGAERLAAAAPALRNAHGLETWKSVSLASPDGRRLRVTSTPARHGPAHMERGPVTGFVLSFDDERTQTSDRDAPAGGVYISGDTVWYEGVAEVGRRFRIHTALLFMGAARVERVGPWNLTFTAEEGVEFARAFPDAAIVPLHFEGWVHFSEGRPEIVRAFAAAGLGDRLHWVQPGRTITVHGGARQPA